VLAASICCSVTRTPPSSGGLQQLHQTLLEVRTAAGRQISAANSHAQSFLRRLGTERGADALATLADDAEVTRAVGALRAHWLRESGSLLPPPSHAGSAAQSSSSSAVAAPRTCSDFLIDCYTRPLTKAEHLRLLLALDPGSNDPHLLTELIPLFAPEYVLRLSGKRSFDGLVRSGEEGAKLRAEATRLAGLCNRAAADVRREQCAIGLDHPPRHNAREQQSSVWGDTLLSAAAEAEEFHLLVSRLECGRRRDTETGRPCRRRCCRRSARSCRNCWRGAAYPPRRQRGSTGHYQSHS